MSVQKQRGETRTPSTDTSGQHGNASAKIAADNAQAILAKTVERTDAKRLADIQDYINASVVYDPDGQYFSGATLKRALDEGCSDAGNILAAIKRGAIDEKTFQFTDKRHGRDGLVCVYLSMTCRIGPFIPIRT